MDILLPLPIECFPDLHLRKKLDVLNRGVVYGRARMKPTTAESREILERRRDIHRVVLHAVGCHLEECWVQMELIDQTLAVLNADKAEEKILKARGAAVSYVALVKRDLRFAVKTAAITTTGPTHAINEADQ
jgi:hypothetical protein